MPKNEIDWTKIQVIVDTREQEPYNFETLVPAITLNQALKSGDYSFICEGKDYSEIFAVERKSWNDWLGSITHDRERFEKEIQRLNEMKYAAVVVERDHESAKWDNPFSNVPIDTALATFYKWSVKYPNVHFFMVSNRGGGMIAIKHLVEGYIKYHHVSPSKSEIAWHKGAETVVDNSKRLVIGIE